MLTPDPDFDAMAFIFSLNALLNTEAEKESIMKAKYEAPKIIGLSKKEIFSYALTQYQFIIDSTHCPGVVCNDGIDFHIDPVVTNGQFTIKACFGLDAPESGDIGQPVFPIQCEDGSSYQTTLVSASAGASLSCPDSGESPYTLVLSLSPNLTSDCVITSIVGEEGNECEASHCSAT